MTDRLPFTLSEVYDIARACPYWSTLPQVPLEQAVVRDATGVSIHVLLVKEILLGHTDNATKAEVLYVLKAGMELKAKKEREAATFE